MRKNMLSTVILISGATLLVLSYLSGIDASAGYRYERGSEQKEYKHEIYYNHEEYQTDGNTEKIEYSNYTYYEKPLAGIALCNFDNADKAMKVVKKIKKEEQRVNEPVYSFSDKEVLILERITEAEATGQSSAAKKNVCSVIINRVESDKFPDTVKEVVFQRHQFSPTIDGRYDSVEVTDSTQKAVKEVLQNGVINKALFFCNESDVKSLKTQKWFKSLTFLFKDDSGHSFFK
jgi:spore germination cell wall hydrolase CwlJ-like protein